MPVASSPFSPTVTQVVRSASQRRTLTLAFEYSALGFALLFGAGLVLLCLGTDIFSGYWLVVVAALAIGLASFRIYRRQVSPYRVAQMLDDKFSFRDALSTAWFLSTSPTGRDDSIARFQVAQAEELARTVRSADAFPLAWNRAWWLTGMLAVAALALFTVRYLVTDSLSLERSLIPIQLDTVFERLSGVHPFAGQRKNDASPAGATNSDLASTARQQVAQNQPSSVEGKPDSGPGASNSVTPGQPGAGQPGNSKGQPAGSLGQSDGRKSASEQTPSGAQGQPAKDGQKAAGSQSDGKHAPAGANEGGSPGLMDKMKDALSGMMAKMQAGGKSAESTEAQASQNRENKEGKTGNPNTAGKNDAAAQSQNAQDTGEKNASGQAQGETKEKAQASQGQSSDQATESGADARSGVGSQDGDKARKEANQQRAMGKLQEIIGKRSANLSGEMSVETPSGKQQLKTAYSERQGQHADRGGEINRDEIPLVYQSYVREYMERVRKVEGGGRE